MLSADCPEPRRLPAARLSEACALCQVHSVNQTPESSSAWGSWQEELAGAKAPSEPPALLLYTQQPSLPPTRALSHTCSAGVHILVVESPGLTKLAHRLPLHCC